MSCILYKKVDGEVVQERIPGTEVAGLLLQGYVADPSELLNADTDKGDASDDDIRAEYERLYGRKPGNMKIETVRQKVAEYADED